jgi:hypothetical protein
MEDIVKQRFIEVIEKLSKSKNDFCKKVGIPPTSLQSQLIGARGINNDTIVKTLGAFPQLSSDWLLRGKGEMLIEDDLPKIRGSEGEDEMALHAEVAKLRGENEELHRALIKADGKVEYLENQVDKLNAMVYTKYQCVATTMDGRLVEPPDGRQGGAAPKCG